MLCKLLTFCLTAPVFYHILNKSQTKNDIFLKNMRFCCLAPTPAVGGFFPIPFAVGGSFLSSPYAGGYLARLPAGGFRSFVIASAARQSRLALPTFIRRSLGKGGPWQGS